MCNSVEGKTQRAVVQSKQSLPLGLQSRHTTGIEEGEQESQSPPAILESYAEMWETNSAYKHVQTEVR